MGIGNKLSKLMDINGTNANELARKIDVSPQTIYSIIKRDSKKADIEVLLKLADTLGVTAEYFVDDITIDNESDLELYSKEELEHLKKYHDLDNSGKSHVDAVLQWESERVASLQKQADHIKQLESRPAAMIGICADGSEDRMRFFSYYQRMASAGSGEFLFQDIPTDVIAVPDTPLSRRADFVIGVNGQSMEPTYFDGDKVLVEKTNSISIGEIGIFIAGTECFIKEAGKDRLISHNEDKEKYPDIIPDERRIDTVGRVLGRIGE